MFFDLVTARHRSGDLRQNKNLEEIIEEILYLKNIVQDDEIVYEESEYGPRKKLSLELSKELI